MTCTPNVTSQVTTWVLTAHVSCLVNVMETATVTSPSCLIKAMIKATFRFVSWV